MKLEYLKNPLLLRREVTRDLATFFSKYLTPDMTVYDIGCGTKPFASLLKGKVKAHIGVDLADGFYDSSSIDLIGSAYQVPIGDGEADAIISSQVLEHLERPADALMEAARILKPDGIMILSCPFLYPIHAAPRDFFRYTQYGLEALFSDAGFTIVEKKETSGFWLCSGFFMRVYLQNFDRGILKKIGIVKILSIFIQTIFLLIHKTEGLLLSLAKKNVAVMRASWTMNYAVVAKRR